MLRKCAIETFVQTLNDQWYNQWRSDKITFPGALLLRVSRHCKRCSRRVGYVSVYFGFPPAVTTMANRIAEDPANSTKTSVVSRSFYIRTSKNRAAWGWIDVSERNCRHSTNYRVRFGDKQSLVAHVLTAARNGRKRGNSFVHQLSRVTRAGVLPRSRRVGEN